MNTLQIIMWVVIVALATAVLYLIGLKKFQNEPKKVSENLLHSCGYKVVKYLKKNETVSKDKIIELIDGAHASVGLGKKVVVAEPQKFVDEVIGFLLDQRYIKKTDDGNYTLKK